MNIKKLIESKLESLTPKQKTLAHFVMMNPERLAFLSISEVSAEVEVSEATIFRFCMALGYDGYVEFSQGIQQSLQKELSIGRRFQLTQQFNGDIKNYSSKFHKSLSNEMNNIANLIESIREDDVAKCIDVMTKAEHFCVIGCMASYALALHFGQMLSKLKPNTDIVGTADIRASAVVNKIGKQSIVFLMAFPRYPEATVELGRIAKERGAKVVALTNTEDSPVAKYADISFIIPVNIISFVDAFTAPTAFATSLLVEFSDHLSAGSHDILQEYDNFAARLSLFEMDS